MWLDTSLGLICVEVQIILNQKAQPMWLDTSSNEITPHGMRKNSLNT